MPTLILSIVVTAALAAAPAAQAAHGGDMRERIARLAGDLVGKRGSPGVVVGTIRGGEQRVFAFGKPSVHSKTPLDGDSLFEIGSVTKAMTCLVLAQLALDGTLDLEDRAQDFLPASVALPREDGREIRLVDLATHHSGLPRMPDNFRPRDPLDPYADYTVDQMYECLNGCELRHGIGERYEYSNLGMGLLGHLLARRAGTDYESMLRARLLEPLGMSSTGVELDEAQRARLARAHLRNGIATSSWHIPTLAGAGAVRSSAHDMLKLLAACLDPPDEAFAAALRLTMEPRHRIGDAMAVGLGWHVRGTDDDRLWWHNGATGGYGSYAAFDPKRRRAVVVLANRQPGGPGPEPVELGLAVLDLLAGETR